MLVSAIRPIARRSREAFTLLEVLVVAAILVILASVGGVYFFKYLEDAKTDTAKKQMAMYEDAIKNYMIAHDRIPPDSLTQLVAPTDGTKPALDGGPALLNDPWGKPYQYNRDNVNQYGDPDPIVSTVDPGNNGAQIFSEKRR